jgi:hypothetical protein
MADRQLYPDGYYRFNAGAIGELGDDDRIYHRATINVLIGKYEAVRILRQIANSAMIDAGGEPYRLTLSFSGTIERIEDD